MTSRQNKARSKKKTAADAVVFCRPAASAAMPPPQAVRRRTTVTRAPRSRARLRLATNSRRFVAKPRTPHPIPQAAQLFKCRSANVRGRGGRPLVLSLGGCKGGYSLSRKRVSPFIRAAPPALPSPLRCAQKAKKEGRAFAQPSSYAGLAAAAVIAATAIVAAAATAAAAAGEDQDDEDQDPQAAAAAKTTVIIAHKTNPL